MGGIGAVAEPLVVIGLLVGGSWINRNPEPGRELVTSDIEARSPISATSLLSDAGSDHGGILDTKSPSRSISPSLFESREPRWRTRTVGFWGMSKEVLTPNNRRFRASFLSRSLERFPFLVEVWYWGLIYWVYQLGRAASAVFIVEGTVHVARDHALQIISLEQKLHIFWELNFQAFLMCSPIVMTWINRIYSFIHIPGSIAFLIWLYYHTSRTARTSISCSWPSSLPTHRRQLSSSSSISKAGSYAGAHHETSRLNPQLFESRRRTMALCNLLAFVIFTLYPCMPPRLLPSDTSTNDSGKAARSFHFVDTVHGANGESSVWTQNRFCNQYAAMPSLHFGYSLLIGLTIMTIPIPEAENSARARSFITQNNGLKRLRIGIPSWQRLMCVVLGIAYPATILVAILATANHFILDAVAGALVCGVAWWGNGVLLNLLVIEDWFLCLIRVAKPEKRVVSEFGEAGDEWARSKGGFHE